MHSGLWQRVARSSAPASLHPSVSANLVFWCCVQGCCSNLFGSSSTRTRSATWASWCCATAWRSASPICQAARCVINIGFTDNAHPAPLPLKRSYTLELAAGIVLQHACPNLRLLPHVSSVSIKHATWTRSICLLLLQPFVCCTDAPAHAGPKSDMPRSDKAGNGVDRSCRKRTLRGFGTWMPPAMLHCRTVWTQQLQR